MYELINRYANRNYATPTTIARVRQIYRAVSAARLLSATVVIVENNRDRHLYLSNFSGAQ